jgi:hypothetical protein
MNTKWLRTNYRPSGKYFVAILVTTILASFSPLALAVPPSLMDQNGNQGGMDKFTGKPVIVFVTSLTQLPKLGKWEDAIRPKLPNINSLDIGDIGDPPSFIEHKVIKELKKHVPKGMSVYIDKDKLWAKEYKLDLSEPCVLIFDAEHTLVKQFSGKPEGKLLDQVITEAEKYFPAPATSEAGAATVAPAIN